MKTVDKNRISLRNFNKWYEDLTAEELIEEYNRLFKDMSLPGRTRKPGKKQTVRKARKRPKGLSQDEKDHLNKRHKRHERDRYSPEQTMEDVDSDNDFIQGLRVSRKRGKPSKTCKVW